MMLFKVKTPLGAGVAAIWFFVAAVICIGQWASPTEIVLRCLGVLVWTGLFSVMMRAYQLQGGKAPYLWIFVAGFMLLPILVALYVLVHVFWWVFLLLGAVIFLFLVHVIETATPVPPPPPPTPPPSEAEKLANAAVLKDPSVLHRPKSVGEAMIDGTPPLPALATKAAYKDPLEADRDNWLETRYEEAERIIDRMEAAERHSQR
jgi:hypothetical protein